MSHDARWRERLAALRAHVGAHGRLPPSGDASGLGNWVDHQRQAKKALAGRVGRAGRGMTSARAAALEAVPGWAWEVEAAWEEKLAALRAFVGAHGRLPPRGDAAGLGDWIRNQRQAKKAAEAGLSIGRPMTPQRAAALEAVPGWAWEVDAEAVWQERLDALRAHVAEHGRLPPQRHPSGLGSWISEQRRFKRNLGRTSVAMTPVRAAALEAVPGWAWVGQCGRSKRHLDS